MQTKRTHLSPLIKEEACGVRSDINVSIIGSKIGEMNLKLTYQLDMMDKDRRKEKMRTFMKRYTDKHCLARSRPQINPISVHLLGSFSATSN